MLQNATAILLQNASGVLLENVTVITKYYNFITKCDSYYKMQRLLQIATVQTIMELYNGAFKKCKKCTSPYKENSRWGSILDKGFFSH